MTRFDVYPTPGKEGHGYVLDVQAGLLDYLKTRVVVPLIPRVGGVEAARDLNPVFMVAEEPHVMLTQAIATVPVKVLRRAVTSLSAEDQDAAAKALDILFTGV